VSSDEWRVSGTRSRSVDPVLQKSKEFRIKYFLWSFEPAELWRCVRVCKDKTKFAELAFVGTALTEEDGREQREDIGIVSEDKDITTGLSIRAFLKGLAFSRHSVIALWSSTTCLLAFSLQRETAVTFKTLLPIYKTTRRHKQQACSGHSVRFESQMRRRPSWMRFIRCFSASQEKYRDNTFK
jgi:hypothetical protein